MFVSCECCVLLGRGFCDELTTRPEESYRLWCVVVCDQETSRMRRTWPASGRNTTEKKGMNFKPKTYRPSISDVSFVDLSIFTETFATVQANRTVTIAKSVNDERNKIERNWSWFILIQTFCSFLQENDEDKWGDGTSRHEFGTRNIQHTKYALTTQTLLLVNWSIFDSPLNLYNVMLGHSDNFPVDMTN